MLVGSLKYIVSCPLIVAQRVNIIFGDSAAFIMRKDTGIRLRGPFASLEMILCCKTSIEQHKGNLKQSNALSSVYMGVLR